MILLLIALLIVVAGASMYALAGCRLRRLILVIVGALFWWCNYSAHRAEEKALKAAAIAEADARLAAEAVRAPFESFAEQREHEEQRQRRWLGEKISSDR